MTTNGLDRALAWTLAVALLGCAAGAEAQVLEVHVDGSVVKYDGPTQYMSDGAHPIALIERPRSLRRAGAGGALRPMAAPPAAVAQAIHEASERHQVSEQLVKAVAWQESGFNPAAVSPKGARGVMQLMPRTALALGVDANDPGANIDGGADYLARMMRRFNGDITKSLAAYNAGPEAVERYQGVPPYAETIAYVNAILGRLGQPAPAETGVIDTETLKRLPVFN